MNLADTPQAFEGHADLADGIRVVLIIASVVLLFWIARATKEAYLHHELGRGQFQRLVSLALLALAVGLGSKHAFGRGAYWTIWLALAGIIVGWWGIVEMRRDQIARRNHGDRRKGGDRRQNHQNPNHHSADKS